MGDYWPRDARAALEKAIRDRRAHTLNQLKRLSERYQHTDKTRSLALVKAREDGLVVFCQAQRNDWYSARDAEYARAFYEALK